MYICKICNKLWDDETAVANESFCTRKCNGRLIEYNLKEYLKTKNPYKIPIYDFLTDIIHEMNSLNPGIEKMIHSCESDDLWSQIKTTIIDKYPPNIGNEIRILLAMFSKNEWSAIYNQILKTTERILQLLCFFLLYELCEALLKKKISLNKDTRMRILENMNTMSIGKYCSLIQLLTKILSPFNKDFFIIEIGHIMNKKFNELIKDIPGERNDAFHYKKNFVEEEYDKKTFEQLEVLKDLLLKLVFLTRYQFISIEDITVQKWRRKKASFNHYMLYLKETNPDTTRTNKEVSGIHTESNSIIVVKDIDNFYKKYICMSPFMIDPSKEVVAKYKNCEFSKDIYLFTGYCKNSKGEIDIYYVPLKDTVKPKAKKLTFYEDLKDEIKYIVDLIEADI